MPPLLEVLDLHTYFFLEQGTLKAVAGVNITLKEREIIGIVGESACGKSTLALSILRLVRRPGRIIKGEIRFRGEDLLKKTDHEMRMVRGNKISMIFQDPVTYLNPSCKIGYQISEGILLHKKTNRKAALEQSVEMLRSMGISSPSQRAMNYPHQFSGGMCQRVMIAMALSCEPHLLIADEPTTALDVTIQAQILELMREIKQSKGTSIILITHDLGIVARMCGFIGIMYAGKIVEYANAYTIFNNPKHPYTIGLINSVPKLSFHQDQRQNKSNDFFKPMRLQTIPGQPPNLSELAGNQCSFLPRCTKSIKECALKEPGVRNIDSEHWYSCFL